MPTLDDLRKSLDQEGRETGWTQSKGSPLRVQLQEVVRLLELAKVEMQKDQAKKLRTLETLLRHGATASPSAIRVTKDGN